MSDKRSEPRTHLGGRDSRSGQFIPVSEARRNPATSQVERIPKPGYGDTGRGKGNKR